jgi:putative ABC transport system permease protein
MLVRDLRAGELTVLVFALVLAVTALSGVGFLADRLERAVTLEAHQLLGGDLLLTADHPWSDQFQQAAQAQGLRIAASATFPSMVSTGQGVQLAEIKAVSEGFPLRGNLRVAPRLNAVDQLAAGVPAQGTVWPDERLAGALALEPSAILQVGALETRVASILTLDPDRGINPFAFAPRLLLNLADLSATGLVQPGSRVSWRLHVAGEADAIAAYRTWVLAHLGRGEKLEDIENARPEIRNVIERAQRFLRLAALLTVVLAAVAVGLSARRYMQRHLDACAVMRCLGATESKILWIYGGEFLLLGLLASLAGCGLGYLVQALLQSILAGLVSQHLPAPGLAIWGQGMAIGMVLVTGFVLPPLLRLKRVPTVRVLRREWNGTEPLSMVSYGLGIASLAMIMYWMAGDLRLGSTVLIGFGMAIAVFALAGWGLLLMLSRLHARERWRIGLANLTRHAGSTLVQVVALSLGLTTLLLLTVAKDDLLSAWQAKLPVDAPNRFLINIQPDQRVAIAEFFDRSGLAVPRLEPMVRGRLTHIGSRQIGPADFPDDRARRLIEREFNLSSRDDLPKGNEIVAGHWFPTGGPTQFSVEQGLADTLKIQLGDELQFDIAGQELRGAVTSLRKLEWDSMRVNFFVIAPNGRLEGQPTSFITSFHLPPGQERFVGDLVRIFPNITVIDVAALLRQLQDTLDQVTRAVEVLFGFALLAGLAVLYAALQASAGERSHELAVLRVLGARRRQLRQALAIEFALLGGMAGVLAGVAAMGIGTALARFVFQLDYVPTLLMPLAGIVAGTLGVLFAGLAATRQSLAGHLGEGLRSG